ncbi:MAG TPA: hypothetical protein VKC66_00845 [Xanthobacteraceae bacterium]|nr:hypothetical protein [Xanthobacteraceae bacterium]
MAPANFVEGYQYISSIIRDNPNIDAGTKFFFQGAAGVNANDPTSEANVYIRTVTAAGLAWDGMLASDPQAQETQLQTISDNIARNVFAQINNDQGIPEISSILMKDAGTAISRLLKKPPDKLERI